MGSSAEPKSVRHDAPSPSLPIGAGQERPVTTAGELLLSKADDDRPAILFGDRSWTFRQLLTEARRRAALCARRMDPTRPPHIGVLLDNMPEYVFWLAAAAISRSVVVGINSTYRGDQLAQLVRHTDCQMIVTSAESGRVAERVGSRARQRSDRRHRFRRLPRSTFAGRGGRREPDARRRRPLPADLHVWLHRRAEGGPVHPGTVRPDGGARGNGDQSQLAATSCTHPCRSSTPAHSSPGGPHRLRPESPSRFARGSRPLTRWTTFGDSTPR